MAYFHWLCLLGDVFKLSITAYICFSQPFRMKYLPNEFSAYVKGGAGRQILKLFTVSTEQLVSPVSHLITVHSILQSWQCDDFHNHRLGCTKSCGTCAMRPSYIYNTRYVSNRYVLPQKASYEYVITWTVRASPVTLGASSRRSFCWNYTVTADPSTKSDSDTQTLT